MSDFLPDQTPEEARRDTAKFKAILVLCATMAFVASPLFTEPFSGFAPDQLPVPVDQPPIQPAGYAFSIWGLIYVWLLASAGYGLIKRDVDAGWDRTRWPLFISLAVGATWIPVALIAPVMSTVMIWIMLGGAVWALLRMPQEDHWWLSLPVGLYAGWLTAASCVALATVVMGYGALPQLVASWAGLALALAMAVPIAQRAQVPTYPIAIGWALVGVVVANMTLLPALAGAAAGGAVGMLWLAFKTWRPKA